MTVTCSHCGSLDIEVQSFVVGESSAMEWYDCRGCGGEFAIVVATDAGGSV